MKLGAKEENHKKVILVKKNHEKAIPVKDKENKHTFNLFIEPDSPNWERY